MDLFQYIFYLGIIIIIFGFLWRWIFVVPAAVLFSLIKSNYGMKFVALIGSYLFASLSVILTLTAISEATHYYPLIYSVVGFFVLFMSYSCNQYEARKNALLSGNYQIRKVNEESNFEAVLSLMVLMLYVIGLFLPFLVVNPVSLWLFGVIGWIYKIPILGWLIGFGGALFLLSIIIYGIVALVLLIKSLIGKIKSKELNA